MSEWTNEGLLYHLHLKEGDVGRYVLLPGDPGRCERIAAHFDDAKLIARNREYVTYTGTLEGEKVSVCSTGIGCPSASIAVEELIDIGADTFIRVGTSGAMQPHLKTGDVAIVTSAIRDEGTTIQYMPMEFPALADVDVVSALKTGAERAGIPYHLGVTQSKDSFYGEVEPERMPQAPELARRRAAWEAGGAICSEMEAAAIFIVCAIQRKRASGVMLIAGGGVDPDDEAERKRLRDVERPIRVAIEGLRELIRRDREG